MKKHLVFSFLITALMMATALLLPSLSFAKPVVLNVMMADEEAFLSSSVDILQKIYAEYAPGVEYRKVILYAPPPWQNLPDSAPVIQELRRELKEKIAAALKPDDQIAYLILETHGGTTLDHRSNLSFFGTFSAAGPDAQFREIFDPLRARMVPNAAIIMNSCSIFADSEGDAVKRSQALLNYFGARDGVVYGANVPEIDTLPTHGKYFSWNNPSNRERVEKAAFINVGLSFLVAIAGAAVGHHPLTDAFLSGVSMATLTAAVQAAWIRYSGEAIDSTWTYNAGYLLQFKQGRLRSVELIQKMKDLARSFGIKRRCSDVF
jgi:hypothetical protein